MGIRGDSSVILLETVVETLSSWWKPYENVVILWKLRWNSVETGRTRLSVFLSWHKNVVIPLETEKTLSSRWQLEKALFIPFIKIRVKQRCYPDWNSLSLRLRLYQETPFLWLWHHRIRYNIRVAAYKLVNEKYQITLTRFDEWLPRC